MRILYVSHRDITHTMSGGAEVYANVFLKHLSNAGHSVDIITSRFDKQRRSESISNLNFTRYRGYLGPHIALPFRLFHLRYDVVIGDLGHVVPWPSLIFSRGKLICIFYHLHRRTLKGQVGKLKRKILVLIEKLYSIIYKRATFVTISSTSHRDLISLGINPDRIVIIPPSIDSKFFKPRKKAEKPHIIYFAGLRDYKRPHLAIQVLQRLLERGIDTILTITGDGPSLKKLQSISRNNNLDKHITFTGKISREELAYKISISHVNVQFSIAEGFGITAIEAAACGTPTVAFKVPGTVDAVKNGENGFLINNGDIDEFVDRVEELIRSSDQWLEKCIKFSKKYSEEVEGNSWLKMVEEANNQK